jgi:hypothetical protein
LYSARKLEQIGAEWILARLPSGAPLWANQKSSLKSAHVIYKINS